MKTKEHFWRLVYRALQRFKIVPKNPLVYAKLSQRINLCLQYVKIRDLEGCVVECGVSQGNSLMVLKVLSLAEEKNRHIYGFDTFGGLPEPLEGENGFKGQFGFSKESVVQFFKDNNVPMEGITLVEGDIRNTLKGFKEPIALLHIDLDLYEGYKHTLDNLWDNVVSGGVVTFDDYGQAKWGGATKAVDEFLAQHPELTLQRADFAKKTYVVKP